MRSRLRCHFDVDSSHRPAWPVAQGISPDTALVELGVDSLALAQLKGQLEGEYACNVPDEVMFRDTTTLRILACLVKAGTFDETVYSQMVESFEIESGTGAKEKGKTDPLVENCPCCLLCCRSRRV